MTQPIILDPLGLPLQGARLIEASAGTGKTWTIAALYVRLVLGHGDSASAFHKPLMPPDILVVTFTEAATQELRERIRSRLTQAARCFRGQSQPDPFLQALIDACDAQQCLSHARTLQLAAEWMDEAAIYTIHGWCNRMLRQHAFDSGSLFNLELDASDQELLNEVARDYWRQFFYPLAENASAAVTRVAATPAVLLGKLKALLREPDGLWLTAEQVSTDVAQPVEPSETLQAWGRWDTQRRTLQDQARHSWLQDKSTIENWLREACSKGWLNGTTYKKDSFEQRLQALATWAETGTEPENRKWLSGFGQSRIALKKDQQSQLLQHPAFVALDAWADHLEQEPDFATALQIHARHWLRQTYQGEKQRRARLDYDDLLLNLDQALQQPGGERLAEVIRQQYPLAMIDEFQDTDPLQYRIFNSIYQTATPQPDSGLLMIGDPKQAIYAFRGADIYTYLQARRDTQGRHYTLNRNFRSTQALVNAVNRLFSHAETHAEGAFKFKNPSDDNPVPFWPVQAQGRKDWLEVEGQAQTAITLWHWQPESEDGLSNLQGYQQAMAEAAAAQIVRLLNLSQTGQAGFREGQHWTPLQAADIAILVRHRHEAAAIRAALSRRGLRSVYLSNRDSVFKTQQASDVLYWLKACAEPGQASGLRAALASKTLDLTLAELDALQADELRWEAETEHFKDLQKIWLYQGVLPMLRRLMADFALPQKLLASDNGERVLTNLLHLSELLQSASVELDGEQALIRYLAQHIDSENAAEDQHLLRLESDSGLIKVVTLHKSKGLEYPLVFLPFIAAFREESGKNPYYRFHAADGSVQIDLAKSAASQQQADHERLQEDLRLLYVGLTRARYACWLGIAPLKVGSSKQCQLHKSAIGHLLSGGAPIQAAELAGQLQALRGDCADLMLSAPPQSAETALVAPQPAKALAEARHYQHKALQRWWISSYSALHYQTGAASLEDDAPDTAQQAHLAEEATRDEQLLPSHSASHWHHFPRGSQAGVFLHGLLEWAAQTGFQQAARDAQLREQAIAPRCERRGWRHWIGGLNQWLAALLALPLLPDRFSLGGLPAKRYQAELEFWLAAEQVDVAQLDALITQHTLAGQPRPKLLPQQLNGMLKGFIDLVFEHEQRYYIVDYKSNWLGDDDHSYSSAAMQNAVLDKRYDVQYSLYLLALHRQLKVRLGAAYAVDQHLGGAIYLFLRGINGPAGGVHFEKPPTALLEALDSLFTGRPECANVD